MVKKINCINFKSEIEESIRPVLVDFWAEWCEGCQKLEPLIQELSTEFEGIIDIKRINIDEEPELAARFEIINIPTLIFFKNGKHLKISADNLPKKYILEMIILWQRGC